MLLTISVLTDCLTVTSKINIRSRFWSLAFFSSVFLSPSPRITRPGMIPLGSFEFAARPTPPGPPGPPIPGIPPPAMPGIPAMPAMPMRGTATIASIGRRFKILEDLAETAVANPLLQLFQKLGPKLPRVVVDQAAAVRRRASAGAPHAWHSSTSHSRHARRHAGYLLPVRRVLGVHRHHPFPFPAAPPPGAASSLTRPTGCGSPVKSLGAA